MEAFPPFLACAVFTAAWPASAQNTCNTHDNVVALLAGKYQEHIVALGVTNVGGLVEVFESKDGATWTITVTSPHGQTCLVAAGEGWRKLDVKPEGPEA